MAEVASVKKRFSYEITKLTNVLSDILQDTIADRSQIWWPLSDPLTDSLGGSLWNKLETRGLHLEQQQYSLGKRRR